MEHYSAIKKEEILPFAMSWMDLEGIMLNEISQTKKDKYCMISLMCGILKKKTNNEFTDSKNKLVVARGEEWGVGKMNVVKSYKLPVIR